MKKEIYIYGGLSLVLIFIVYYAYSIYRKRKMDSYSSTTNTYSEKDQIAFNAESTNTVSPPEGISSFPLKEGMMNNDYVLKLQESLNKLYDAGLVEDGDFGPLTKEAVKEFMFNETVSLDSYTSLLQRSSEDSSEMTGWLSKVWTSYFG